MKIAFCVPGNQFSGRFLDSWTNLIKMLRPTHYMWIDSDQVFNWNHFMKLVEHNVPIVSGIYHRTTGGFSGFESSDKFAASLLGGATLKDKDIKNKKGLMEVHANGMGFMLVQRQVFDLVENPFYSNNPDTWEDFSFAEKSRAKGFKSYIDPEVIIGHEKMLVI